MRFSSLSFVVFIIISLNINNLFAQSSLSSGTIKGRLVDKATLSPLAGANIEILNRQQGAATDENGYFEIFSVEPGSYSLKFSYISYEPVIKVLVILRPQRSTHIEIALKMSDMVSEAIEVTADYFSENDEQVLSTINFSAEEIRRAPGSGCRAWRSRWGRA